MKISNKYRIGSPRFEREVKDEFNHTFGLIPPGNTTKNNKIKNFNYIRRQIRKNREKQLKNKSINNNNNNNYTFNNNQLYKEISNNYNKLQLIKTKQQKTRNKPKLQKTRNKPNPQKTRNKPKLQKIN